MKTPHGFNTQIHRLSTFIVSIGILIFSSIASAQLPAFTMSFDPTSIDSGSVSRLTYTISNSGSTSIRNLSFTNDFPIGLTLSNPVNTSSTCFGAVDASNSGTSVSYVNGGILANTTCTISVDVTSGLAGVYNNVTGNLTSDEGNSGNASAMLTVNALANRPLFSKDFSPDSIFFGGRSTLTLTIDNSANTTVSSNITFTDNLPEGMEIADPANANTTCNGGNLIATAGGNVISYRPNFFFDATVGAGEVCTVTVDVVANAIGELINVTNEMTSTSSQFGFPPESSGTATAVLTVDVEPISLSKLFLNDPVAPGDLVDLQFTIINLSRLSAASNISFDDDLTQVLSGLTATNLPANPCGPGSQLTGTTSLSLIGGNLEPEQSCTFTVPLQVSGTAIDGIYTNVTSLISAEIDGNLVTGNTAADQLFVASTPSLIKTFLDNPVGTGGSVTLEFSITNISTVFNATEIGFEDIFDTVLPTASSVPANGFCGSNSTATYTPLINPTGSDANPARLQVANMELAAGETCTFSLVLDVLVGAATGTYSNTTSEVVAVINEEPVTGSAASDDLQIVAGPTLIKEYIDDPVLPGETVTLLFTLAHDENASADATNITFTDDLDASLSGLVATGLPLIDICGTGSSIDGTMTLSFTGGILTPAQSCSFPVSLQVPTTAISGSYTNSTSNVLADVSGLSVIENPAVDQLIIAGLTMNKEFIDDPVIAGDTVTLNYTLLNASTTSNATDITFLDDFDDTLSGLAGDGILINDVCGVGNGSITWAAGNSLLIFQSGALGIGETCTFSVSLQVPLNTLSDTYSSRTSQFVATVEGQTLSFENAQDDLIVSSELISLSKEFIDDPVVPGNNVTLRFTLSNLDQTNSMSDISFGDDLDAALNNLTNISGTLNDICGVGSSLSGTSQLSFTGGSLAAGASCMFDVLLSVPPDLPFGVNITNVTSTVNGLINGLPVTGAAASDELQVIFSDFSKSFDSEVVPGGTVNLTFNIAHNNPNDSLLNLSFSDDLNAVIPGLVALGLPLSDVCGSGSLLSGTSLITLTNASLLPNGSCTFNIELSVPLTAEPGNYLNVTSDLIQLGLSVANPASAGLIVIFGEVDDDDDGVLNSADRCPGTVIPESVPTVKLGKNRYALVDDDFLFDTVAKGKSDTFTTTDTFGCSCEQIIEIRRLGNGQTKFGCSVGIMRSWVKQEKFPRQTILSLIQPGN